MALTLPDHSCSKWAPYFSEVCDEIGSQGRQITVICSRLSLSDAQEPNAYDEERRSSTRPLDQDPDETGLIARRVCF